MIIFKVAGFVPSFFGPNKIESFPKMMTFGDRIQLLGEAIIIKIVGGESPALLCQMLEMSTHGELLEIAKGVAFTDPSHPQMTTTSHWDKISTISVFKVGRFICCWIKKQRTLVPESFLP